MNGIECGQVRVCIVVDASNLFISFRNMFDQKAQMLEVNWQRLCDYICALVGGTEWQLQYFVGVPYEDDPLARTDEPRWSRAMFAAIRAVGGGVYEGSLVRVPDGQRSVHREKMVDTYAASMLVHGATANEFDIGVVISADMDLVPPVRLAATLCQKPMHVFYLDGMAMADRTREVYRSTDRVTLHGLEDVPHMFVEKVRIYPQRVLLSYDMFAMWAAIWGAQHARVLRGVEHVELNYLLDDVQYPGLGGVTRAMRYDLIGGLFRVGLIETYPFSASNLTGVRIAQRTLPFVSLTRQ